MTYEEYSNKLDDLLKERNWVAEYIQTYQKDGREGVIIFFQDLLNCDKDMAEKFVNECGDFSVPHYSGSPNPSNTKPEVQCPYCRSVNTHKISVMSKAVNTAIFGLFGTKRHKQWHCNSCGSEW